jgi:hypothetical protein
VSQLISEAWDLAQMGMITGGIVALVALLAWLAGLVMALRGTAPKDRPQILRAYAVCRPPLVRQAQRDAQVPRVHDQPSTEPPPAAW